MGRGLCLPGADRSVDVSSGWVGGGHDRAGDGGLAGTPRSKGESRGEFEGRIKKGMCVNGISAKIAWRNILRQRWYSLIHVLGLAIGMSVCIVIYLIGRYELSFDNFHPDANRIYRIVGDVQDKDGNVIFLNSPFREVAGIEHMIAGFEAKTSFHVFGSTITVASANGRAAQAYDNRQEGSYALSTILTGPDFFRLFPHQWLAGTPSVLNQPERLVLAESVARKYFGTDKIDQILGRKVIYDDSLTLVVAGVVEECNRPSVFNSTSFLS